MAFSPPLGGEGIDMVDRDERAELNRKIEQRLDRDDERERVDARRVRIPRRATYARFRTLARIAENLDACVTAEQAALANTGKRAA